MSTYLSLVDCEEEARKCEKEEDEGASNYSVPQQRQVAETIQSANCSLGTAAFKIHEILVTEQVSFKNMFGSEL